MVLFLATPVLAGSMHLPMPTAALCPNSPVEASMEAGSDLEYPEWGTLLECDTETSCLSVIRRLQDPSRTVRDQRITSAEAWSPDMDSGPYIASPVGVKVELTCLGTGATATWDCDQASCSLETTRAAPGLVWTAQPWGTVPGSPEVKVGALVAKPEVELSSLAKTEIADMAAQAAARMVAVMDECERGGCGEGWRPLRAYAQSLATVQRPEFVSFSRGMWDDRGFVAEYRPAGLVQPAGLVAEFDCYAISGDCDMHEEACNLAIRRDEQTLATLIGGQTVVWENDQFGIRSFPHNSFGYARVEGHAAR